MCKEQAFISCPGPRRVWLLGLLLSVVVALAAILPSTAAASGWTDLSLGSLNVDQTDTVTHASITDVGGVPYTAWAESTPDGARSYVFAARYTGGAWDGVGGLIDQNGGAPEITSIAGLPYLAYTGHGGQVYVDWLHNGVWQTIGGAPLAAPINDTHNQAEWVSIVGDRYGVPYVAWSESSAGDQSRVYVSAYLQGSWYSTTPGHSLNFDPHDIATVPRIANINGTLWVTWLEHFSDGWRVLVEYYNGTQWVPAGTPQDGIVATDPDGPNIADIGGVPYIVWDDVRSGVRQVHVARYDPHATPNWVPVGGAVGGTGPDTGGGRSSISGITSVNGVPWVTWTEHATGVVRVHVAEFAAGEWEEVFGPLNTDASKNAILPSIANVAGQPYVTFLQETTNQTTGALFGVPWELHVVVPQREMPLHFTSVRAARTQAGLTFAIALSRPANVRLDFLKPALGRMVRGVCQVPTDRNLRRPRCVRSVPVGTVSFQGHRGLNHSYFDDRLSATRKLVPGRYKVRITLTDAGSHLVRRWVTVRL